MIFTFGTWTLQITETSPKKYKQGWKCQTLSLSLANMIPGLLGIRGFMVKILLKHLVKKRKRLFYSNFVAHRYNNSNTKWTLKNEDDHKIKTTSKMETISKVDIISKIKTTSIMKMTSKMKNTSQAAPGALAHSLQCNAVPPATPNRPLNPKCRQGLERI